MKSLTTALRIFTLILKCLIIKLHFMYVNSIGKIHGHLYWTLKGLSQRGEICLISVASVFFFKSELPCVLQTYFSLCFFYKFLSLLWLKMWEFNTLHFLPAPRFSWTSSEVEEVQGASLLVAADVIYSDDLTDAFFSTLERLMSQGSEKVLMNAVCN